MLPNLMEIVKTGVSVVLVLAGIVNFLHGSWYGAMFGIFAEDSVDNTGMFWLLLSSA